MKLREQGCILKLSPLGDYGLIVTWCTAGHGVLRTAARNARKPGSDFTGRLDLFHECELMFSQPARGDLATLHSAELLSPRLPLRRSLLQLRLCSYLANLLLATVEPGAPGEEWHKLMSGALDYIATSPLRPAILEHFEKRLATLHGIYTAAMPAHAALQQHFGSLPAGRAELVEKLRQADAASMG